jgi:outer membrane lipoprotein-sorting protein
MTPGFSCSAVATCGTWCVAAALALMPVSGASHAADLDLAQLMQGLAQTRSGHAAFTEKKFIAMLDKPVESSGELFYRAPDRLEKRTIKPKPESMILDGGTVVIERGRQKHSLQLQDYPELAAVIDSVRGTLAGDRKALERSYRLVLEGGAEQWVLQLLPVDEKMQALIKRIRITGVRYDVRSIEVNRADGDSSLMIIEKLAAR